MLSTLLMASAMIVAAEQREARYVVIDPSAKDGYVWEWKPSEDAAVGKHAGSFGNPSEVKPRPEGKLLVAASGSGFAKIDMRRKTPVYFGVVRAANLHSIEELPGGVVAAACSDGNCVALIDVKAHPLEPDKQRQDTSTVLEQAHGVVWFPYRRPFLYAIGKSHVVEYRYDTTALKLTETRRFDFTAAGCGMWGHDLMRDGDGRLVFTTHDAMGRLDLETGKIELLEPRKAVKSHSLGDDGKNLYCVPKEKWWTDTLLVSDGTSVVRPGARFYKARWIVNNWSGPDPRLPFADPFVHFEKGVYYAYGTHSGDGIAVATSTDLKTWKLGVGKAGGGLALHKDDSYGKKWFWAPEVYRRADGRYVMVYSAEQCACAAVGDSPLGPFAQVEKKPLLDGTEHAAGAIDNTIFRDDDGRVWMFYAHGGICLVELETDMLHVKKGAKPHYLFGTQQPWERHVAACRVNEGPFVLKHDGTYYLTYSGNDYQNPHYGIGLATAKSVTGPWTKLKANPIMIRKAELFGTAHHSFFTDAKGELRIVFHAHPDGTFAEPRHMYIASARFSEKDGEKTIEIGDDVITAVIGSDAGDARAAGADRKQVFVNYDDTHYAHSRTKNGIVPDENEIRGLVRQYKGTDVTDLLFCIGGRIADVPNGAKDSWCDKYHQTRENGRDVSYTNHYLKLYRELYEVRKLDLYALWCDEAHKIGIHPWLSFRLNDCHDNAEPASFLHPDFFHEHPECRRIRHREPRGYFDRCFDFDCAAVRERELKFIAEMLERYDADGVELDWQREIYCFQPGRENAATLTDFTRRVRSLADAAAKRRGHPVKVMARVPANPETALRFGFDVAAWADDRLVDVVVPCPRWESTDNEIPTDLWKRLLRGSGITLAPGIEIRICDRPWEAPFYMLTDQLVGATAWHYSSGADGIYFYNYFDDPGWKKPETQYWQSFRQPIETMAVWWGNQLKWLKFIGQADKVFAAPRDHMLTYRDIVPLWEDVRRPFPTTIRAGQVRFFRLATGTVPADRRLTLRIGVKDGKPPKRVFVNSRPCTYLGNAPCVPSFTDAPLCRFDVPAFDESLAIVEILPDADVELTHLDLQVRSASRVD